MTSSSREVTELLNRWAGGDEDAGEKVLPLVYGELRRIARRSMKRQGPSHTLQTTAVVHEAYLRLVGDRGKQWENPHWLLSDPHILSSPAREPAVMSIARAVG